MAFLSPWDAIKDKIIKELKAKLEVFKQDLSASGNDKLVLGKLNDNKDEATLLNGEIVKVSPIDKVGKYCVIHRVTSTRGLALDSSLYQTFVDNRLPTPVAAYLITNTYRDTAYRGNKLIHKAVIKDIDNKEYVIDKSQYSHLNEIGDSSQPLRASICLSGKGSIAIISYRTVTFPVQSCVSDYTEEQLLDYQVPIECRYIFAKSYSLNADGTATLFDVTQGIVDISSRFTMPSGYSLETVTFNYDSSTIQEVDIGCECGNYVYKQSVAASGSFPDPRNGENISILINQVVPLIIENNTSSELDLSVFGRTLASTHITEYITSSTLVEESSGPCHSGYATVVSGYTMIPRGCDLVCQSVISSSTSFSGCSYNCQTCDSCCIVSSSGSTTAAGDSCGPISRIVSGSGFIYQLFVLKNLLSSPSMVRLLQEPTTASYTILSFQQTTDSSGDVKAYLTVAGKSISSSPIKTTTFDANTGDIVFSAPYDSNTVFLRYEDTPVFRTSEFPLIVPGPIEASEGLVAIIFPNAESSPHILYNSDPVTVQVPISTASIPSYVLSLGSIGVITEESPGQFQFNDVYQITADIPESTRVVLEEGSIVNFFSYAVAVGALS